MISGEFIINLCDYPDIHLKSQASDLQISLGENLHSWIRASHPRLCVEARGWPTALFGIRNGLVWPQKHCNEPQVDRLTLKFTYSR